MKNWAFLVSIRSFLVEPRECASYQMTGSFKLTWSFYLWSCFLLLLLLLLLLFLLLLLASMQSLFGGNLFYGWVRWVGQVIDLLNGRENFFRLRTWFFGYEKEIFLEEMDPCVWARWVGQTNPFLTTILDH